MKGFKALAQLGDYVIATGLLKTADVDRLNRKDAGLDEAEDSRPVDN
jgi:hypothetical protein